MRSVTRVIQPPFTLLLLVLSVFEVSKSLCFIEVCNSNQAKAQSKQHLLELQLGGFSSGQIVPICVNRFLHAFR